MPTCWPPRRRGCGAFSPVPAGASDVAGAATASPGRPRCSSSTSLACRKKWSAGCCATTPPDYSACRGNSRSCHGRRRCPTPWWRSAELRFASRRSFCCPRPTSPTLSPEPQCPHHVHQSVRNPRRQQATAVKPGAPVEDAGEGGQQHVAPVEGRGLVEVRETEEDRRAQQGGHTAQALFQQVLQQTAEEEFFRDGDENEGDQERARHLGRRGQPGVRLDEIQSQTQADPEGREQRP